MQIKPSSDPLFRHRHQYILRQGKRPRNRAWLWAALFVVLLGVGAYYGYQWLNFTQFDLQALMQQFKSQQAATDEDKARLENPDDVARQALKPSSPEQARLQIPSLQENTEEPLAAEAALTTPTVADAVRQNTASESGATQSPTSNSPNSPLAAAQSVPTDAEEEDNSSAESAAEASSTTIIVDETVLARLQQPDKAASEASEALAQALENEPISLDEPALSAPPAEASQTPEATAPETDDSGIQIPDGETTYNESAGGIALNIELMPPSEATDKEAKPDEADNDGTSEKQTGALQLEDNADSAEAADTAVQQAERIKALQQQASQQIATQQLEAAFDSYQALQALDAKLASPVLDAIFLAYQEQVEAHLAAKELPQALHVYAAMLAQDAQHISVSAALNAIMAYQQERLEALIGQRKLHSGQPSALDLYQEIQQFAPEHEVTHESQAQLLQALLSLADEQIKTQKYTTPASNNAFDTYQAALKLLPNHAGASEGLRRLAQIYANIADKHLASGRLKSAQIAVQRGAKVLPNYSAWQPLRTRIQQAQAAKNPQNRLVSRLKAQIEAGKLTRPSGDNAYETLQQLKAQHPDEPYTQSALNQIATRYVELAAAKRQAGELRNSMALINEGLALAPTHAALQKLKQQVLAEY